MEQTSCQILLSWQEVGWSPHLAAPQCAEPECGIVRRERHGDRARPARWDLVPRMYLVESRHDSHRRGTRWMPYSVLCQGVIPQEFEGVFAAAQGKIILFVDDIVCCVLSR